MSKRDKRTVDLEDYKASKAEEGSIPIRTKTGDVFVIPPPALWPDETLGLVENRDVIAAARLLIGADRYDDFVAQGGTAQLVFALIKDEQGLDAGE